MKEPRCSPECAYYPLYPSKILKEYHDENGLKHRESVFICQYDGHRIEDFCNCKNFKSNRR